MTRIAIIGTGYVGLTTGACFAHLGHEVVCADIDAAQGRELCRGEIPIVEHGLEELVEEGLRSGNLRSCSARPTPWPTARSPSSACRRRRATTARPTSPTSRRPRARSRPVLPYESRRRQQVDGAGRLDQGRRAGAAADPTSRSCRTPSSSARARRCSDFLKPDRVVVGSDDQAAAIKVASLYDGDRAPRSSSPTRRRRRRSSTRPTPSSPPSSRFVNAIAAICEGVGADVNDVVLGIGYDKRIGQRVPPARARAGAVAASRRTPGRC